MSDSLFGNVRLESFYELADIKGKFSCRISGFYGFEKKTKHIKKCVRWVNKSVKDLREWVLVFSLSLASWFYLFPWIYMQSTTHDIDFVIVFGYLANWSETSC